MTPNHLLLAIDQSDAGEAAIDFTIGYASLSAAEVTVLHIRELSPMLRVPPLESATMARELVERSVAALREAGIAATGLISTAREDAVARRIVDVAIEERCAGIVLGSFRSRGFHRLTGRGVRERVLRTSHLPVVVAPPALKYSRRTLSSALSHAGRT
jgi:nucleotide-binding universal stress UspA family protein